MNRRKTFLLKLCLTVALSSLFPSGSFSGSCEQIVKKMDWDALHERYAKIAWLMYRIKKKREKIAHEFAHQKTLTKIRAAHGQMNASAFNSFRQIPAMDILGAELDTLLALNKMDLSFYRFLVNQDISEEIGQKFIVKPKTGETK
jgi:hypothetical protein